MICPKSVPCLLLMGLLLAAACQRSDPNPDLAAEIPTDSIATEQAAATPPEITGPTIDVDLPDIRERGRLVALTGYSATSYFIYRGAPMGFEYELLTRLAEHLDLDLDIVVVRDLDRIFDYLNQGRGDIVAYNMTVTKSRLEKVAFTDHHTAIRQMLVQRLPDNWRQMKRHEIDDMLIKNPIDLIGRKVHVRKGSSYFHRLRNLSDEIGGDIDIVEVPGDVSTESLIERVATGEIEFTVADENVAQINAGYHSNIDIGTPVSLYQRIAWAVRNNSPELTAAINRWLAGLKRQPTFNVLYNKYHRNTRFFSQRVTSEFFSLTGNKISPYDSLIQAGAATLGWDWRLLASQIYQESQFDPKARSWAGAHGLMQLMPQTARQFGTTRRDDPVENIAAGVRYIQWLENYWSAIPDSLQRVKFILASYNAGQGHVEDARNLARKFDRNPDVWDDQVAEFMLKKSQERYFNDPVVQFGYCRGEEPVNYVNEILERYNHYQKFVDLVVDAGGG